jgi:hypothetical protein
VLLPRQRWKLARGAKDKEHAMSENPNATITVGKLKALGHDARLMPAKYVRPYSKGQWKGVCSQKLGQSEKQIRTKW